MSRQDTVRYCLREKHFKLKDIARMNGKDVKIYLANSKGKQNGYLNIRQNMPYLKIEEKKIKKHDDERETREVTIKLQMFMHIIY